MFWNETSFTVDQGHLCVQHQNSDLQCTTIVYKNMHVYLIECDNINFIVEVRWLAEINNNPAQRDILPKLSLFV